MIAKGITDLVIRKTRPAAV